MASEHVNDDNYLPIHAAITESNPPQADVTLGRMHLNTALKLVLIAALLPLVSGSLWFVNVFTYFMEPERPRLCDVTPRHCDTAMSLAVVLAVPSSAVFILAALFTLDQYLSVSDIFNSPKTLANPPPEIEANPHSDNSQLCSTKEHRAAVVLRIFTVLPYVLGSLWTVASIVAIVNASLVLIWDLPFSGGSDDSGKYKARVFLGYGEALVDAVLAYYMTTIAITLSRARETLVGDTASRASQDGGSLTERLSRAWDVCLERNWRPRSDLCKAFLCLLIALVSALVSGIFSIAYSPFAHLRYIGDGYYFTFTALTALVIWPLLLVLHSHRFSEVLPGPVLRVVLSAILLLLAALWLLVSTAFLVLCVGALFCTTGPSTPLPPSSPCLYIRGHGAWTGFAAILLGYIQGLILGGAAVIFWRARGGIRLEENPEGERGVTDSSP